MAASREPTPTGPGCGNCWPTWKPGGLIAWWCTRWTGSAVRCWTSRALWRCSTNDASASFLYAATQQQQPDGTLTLNVLLSFAQFEREIISERTRDKQSAARRKGKWIGGYPMLGYDPDPSQTRLVVNEAEAKQVLQIFRMYLRHGALIPALAEMNRRGLRMKSWTQGRAGRISDGRLTVPHWCACSPTCSTSGR